MRPANAVDGTRNTRMKILTWNIWQYAVPWDKPELPGVVAGYPAHAPRPAP